MRRTNSLHSENKFKIDFVGVGFPKCGTTWIAACLDEHPEVDFAEHKETNYFLPSDLGYIRNIKKNFIEQVRCKTFEQYKREFSGQPGLIKGEFSVRYVYYYESLRTIKRRFPNVKILVALRDPVDFLYSAYWFDKNSNAAHLFPDTFEEALEKALPGDWHHIERAYFDRYIKWCFEIFDRDQIHFIFLEDIKSNPSAVLREMYSFLGVAKNFKPSYLGKHVNPAREHRAPWVARFFNVFVKIAYTLPFAYDLINKENWVFSFYKGVIMKEHKHPPMKLETQQYLRKRLYPMVCTIEELLDCDLSSWK